MGLATGWREENFEDVYELDVHSVEQRMDLHRHDDDAHEGTVLDGLVDAEADDGDDQMDLGSCWSFYDDSALIYDDDDEVHSMKNRNQTEVRKTLPWRAIVNRTDVQGKQVSNIQGERRWQCLVMGAGRWRWLHCERH